MLRQILAIASLASVIDAARAGATLEVTQYGAEVPLTELNLPDSEFGLLRFAVCGGCPTQSGRLSGDTEYFFNNQALPYVDFLAAVTTARAAAQIAGRSIAGVFFDAATRSVESVAVVTPSQP